MNRMVLFVITLLLASVTTLRAQTDSLLIGPGDVVSIQVLEAPELNQHARVTDEGEVPLILGGDVKISGLSPADAAAAVQNALVKGQYLVSPHVSVTVERYATQSVTVIGQVHRPGTYEVGTPRSLLDVLAEAGGSTDLADRHITIERRVTKEKINYFLSNSPTVALDNSPKVDPGDTVVVPKIDVVYVLGDVFRPGGYPMSTNDGKLSLLEAVTLAGSQQPHAVPNSTRLIRKNADGTYVESKIELSKIEKGKQQDVLLQPDDIIYIPFSYLRNMGTSLGSMLTAAGSAAIYRY